MIVVKQKEVIGVSSDTGANLDIVLPQVEMTTLQSEEHIIFKIVGAQSYAIHIEKTAFTQEFLDSIRVAT